MSGESWEALVRRLREAEASEDRSGSGASPESLGAVREKVERAAAALAAGEPSAAVRPMQEAARLVSDGWSFTSQLGADVIAHKQAVERAHG